MLKKILLLLIIVTVAVTAYLVDHSSKKNEIQNQVVSLLEKKGDFCTGIAEHAVANLQAIVEFQGLEILARKANVMRQCMKDQGFDENPAWLSYASSLAIKNALNQKISEDEALQNLVKQDMYIFTTQKNKPLYWKKVESKSN